MKEFKNKVAVVTGAASGIGLALVRHALNEGMQVVLADVEDSALAATIAGLADFSNRILALRTDVSQAQDVERLAQAATERFGAVHLLFNNAGVGGGSSVVESSLQDWEWQINVNLWGVIHGIHSFAPRMLAHGEPCHIVNTASIAGLIAGPAMGIYKATKHAVVSLSETMYLEMKAGKLPLNVSVLCPGFVRTKILDAGRNRPAELSNPGTEPPTQQQLAVLAYIRNEVANGIAPEQVAALTFEAIREERFYILSHPEFKAQVAERMENIVSDRNPVLPA